MQLDKPANRPRFAIGKVQRVSIGARVRRRVYPSRPFRGVIITQGGGRVRIGEAVAIIAGPAKGSRGVVVFSGEGIAYVRVGDALVRVLADYLVPIGPGPGGPQSQP